QLVVQHSLVCNRIGPWLFENVGILNRDFIPQNVWSNQPDAFLHAHGKRVRNILIAHVLFDSDRIDDERIAFPASDGMAIEAGLEIVQRFLGLIEKYSPNLRESFFDHGDLSSAL